MMHFTGSGVVTRDNSRCDDLFLLLSNVVSLELVCLGQQLVNEGPAELSL